MPFPHPIKPDPVPPDRLHVQRVAQGAVLVRVRSCCIEGQSLPDAVFTFRPGDPQYERWSALAPEAVSLDDPM